MKKRKASPDPDPEPPLRKLNAYLEKNFPDFFAEARFQVGDDDYFLYARFGQYLARTIELNRAPASKINRGFTVLNRMARASTRHPRIRADAGLRAARVHRRCAQGARAGAQASLARGAGAIWKSLCE